MFLIESLLPSEGAGAEAEKLSHLMTFKDSGPSMASDPQSW